KIADFAVISYVDEPNSYSLVSVKRLIDVDQFGKGTIREKNKTYRIVVERTGSKCDMERFAKDAETTSAYTMNAEVVSDTEEWQKRKQSSTKNIQEQQIRNVDKQLDELHSFGKLSSSDFDENPTYTTLNPCSFDELDAAGIGR
ncbi:unnamed protein product, partial [Adineta ricciae]